jgi:molybdopterin-guanine dinucleotide biosynthesis protein A
MEKLTGIVLAGGLARRLGGVDKALEVFEGRPLLRRVLERLAPQVDEVLISANRNIEVYESYGLRVVQDEYAGFAGPLAGLHAGLRAASHPLLLSVPCDAPDIAPDLAARLRAALGANDAAVASAGGRMQPVFALLRRGVLPGLEAYLSGGGHKAEAWLRSLAHVEVDFGEASAAFRNLNTPEDFGR